MEFRKVRRPTGKACALDMTGSILDVGRDKQRYVGVEDAEFLKGEMERRVLSLCTGGRRKTSSSAFPVESG